MCMNDIVLHHAAKRLQVSRPICGDVNRGHCADGIQETCAAWFAQRCQDYPFGLQYPQQEFKLKAEDVGW